MPIVATPFYQVPSPFMSKDSAYLADILKAARSIRRFVDGVISLRKHGSTFRMFLGNSLRLCATS